MGIRIRYIRLAALLLFGMAACWLSVPQEVKAVTAEENGQSVITESKIKGSTKDFLVGRYQMNYTGNVNYYRIMDSVEEASNPGTGTNKATDARKQAAAKALGLGAKAEKITNSTNAALKKGSGANGTVVKAYLVWETRSKKGAMDAVALVRPDGTAKKVKATYAAKDVRGCYKKENGVFTKEFDWRYSTIYTAYADVTSFVQADANPYGTYSVCNLPIWKYGENGDEGLGESISAWQLVIVEEGDALPIRAVQIGIGAVFNQDYQLESKKVSQNLFLENILTMANTGDDNRITGQLLVGATSSKADNDGFNESVQFSKDGKDRGTFTKKGLATGNNGIVLDLKSIASKEKGFDANNVKFTMSAEKGIWSTFFLYGVSVDLQREVVSGAQTTKVNSASSVTVSQKITNTSSQGSTGFYKGKLIITLDSALTPDGTQYLYVYDKNGEQTNKIAGKWDSAQHVLIFEHAYIRCLDKKSYLQYSISCTVAQNSGKKKFQNSAQLSGKLRSRGFDTDVVIDNLLKKDSQDVPMYKVTVVPGENIKSVKLGSTTKTKEFSIDYTYGDSVSVTATPDSDSEFTKWTRKNEGTGSTGDKKSNPYTFTMPTQNVTLTAYGKVNQYTVTLHAETGIASVSGGGKYKVGTKVSVTAVLKEGYHFKGWTGTYQSGTVNYSFTMPAKNVDLTANGELTQYKVTLHAGTGIQSVSEGGTYTFGEKVSITAVLKEGYHFKDWTGTYQSGSIAYSFAMPSRDVDMTANAEVNQYTIHFHPNGGAELSHVGDIVAEYGQGITLPNIIASDGTAAYVKYTLDGGNVTEGVLSGVIPESMMYGYVIPEGDDTEQPEDETEAAETEPESKEKATGTEATEDDMDAEFQPTVYPSVFLGWALEENKDKPTAQWKADETVKNLVTENGGEITLYAVWDDCPWIVAEDLYYSLEQAQSGFITEAEILSHATASDREDGSPILPGFHENGTSFSIPDYHTEDYTGLVANPDKAETFEIKEILTVIDSVGSMYGKEITVHVVDTTPQPVTAKETTRFIDEYFYNQPFEDGGLEDNSVWKTDSEYVGAIMEAFHNLTNDTPVMEFNFSHEDVLRAKEYIQEHGIGNSKEPNALSNFYDTFMLPNRTK